jgi:DNA-binding transcriptional MocR family regulator
MFVPGVAFYKDNIDAAALRLSFAAPGVADIEIGVQRMKLALDRFSDAG